MTNSDLKSYESLTGRLMARHMVRGASGNVARSTPGRVILVRGTWEVIGACYASPVEGASMQCVIVLDFLISPFMKLYYFVHSVT